MIEQNLEAAHGILTALRYIDTFSASLDSDFITVEVGPEYDQMLDKALDYIGVPEDDYDNELDVGHSRDWVAFKWLDYDTTPQQFIDWVLPQLDQNQTKH